MFSFISKLIHSRTRALQYHTINDLVVDVINNLKPKDREHLLNATTQRQLCALYPNFSIYMERTYKLSHHHLTDTQTVEKISILVLNDVWNQIRTFKV